MTPALDAFAEALWQWEECPNQVATPEVIQSLKRARERVRAGCGKR